MSARYAELQVTSHFSFLRGASSAEELFERAAALGIEALAVIDRNSLAGIVRAHEAAKATGVRLVVGCWLDLADGTSVLVYPTDRPAYARLCRLLSLGKRRAGKARCHLEWEDLVAYGEDLIAVLVPDLPDADCGLRLRRLREAFGDRAYLALTLRRRPNDQLRLHELANLAARMRVLTVVTNDVTFHEPGRRILQDVVTCIRHNVTIDALGDRRERHADRYLKPPEEMHRLFGRYPEALARTLEIVERCRFSLDELAYQYPEERDDPSLTPQQTLEKLTWAGAAEHFPEGLPERVRATLEHELRLIGKLDYAPYFLTVNAIVRFARSQDILCQGRGSAANSAVCYVLGITSIDPGRNDLLFERFVSEERREPPDIDVDFEHERREIVMQWVFDTYGRDRAALCATVTFKHTGGVSKFRDKLIDGMVANGYERDFAEKTFRQLEGFGSYGFPESHAASFALIAYASAWLKCWHPDVFCAALLNSQPMGFYAPAQIVRDAEVHGVEVRPVCVNASRWDCTLEPTDDEGRVAVRLGLRMVKGLANAHAAAIVAARTDQPFASVDDLWRRAAVPQAALVRLAEADAFRPAFGLARREALWAIRGLADEPLPLFAAAAAREARPVPEAEEPIVPLRPMPAGGEVVADYRHLGLSLRRHPVAFLREDLRRRRIVTCAEVMAARDGRGLEAAGIVLVRQRPGSAKGVLFITLEDETGIANLVVWPKVFEANRRTVMSASMLAVRGRIQREGEVVHLVARRFANLSADLASVGGREADFPLPHGRGDQVREGRAGPDPRDRPPKVFRGRDLADPYGHIDEIRVKTRDFR